MKNVKKISKRFRIFFQVTFYALPLLLVILWGNIHHVYDSWLSTLIIPASIHVFHQFTVMNMFYGFLVDLIPVIILMIICHYLIKLFELYEKGIVFSLQNIHYITMIGWFLFIQQVVHIVIYQPLITFAMTIGNPFGENQLGIIFSRENLIISVVGLLTVLIAWIMGEARKIRDKQNYHL